MSRFLVFAGEDYYPRGGWRDFHSAHDTAESAVATAKQIVLDRVGEWSHAVDSAAKKEIKVFIRADDGRRSEVWMFNTFDERDFVKNGIVIDQGDPL